MKCSRPNCSCQPAAPIFSHFNRNRLFCNISCLILCFQVLEECLGKSSDETQLDDSSPADNVPVSHVGLSSYYRGEDVEIGN